MRTLLTAPQGDTELSSDVVVKQQGSLSQNQLFGVLEQLKDGVLVFQPSGECVWSNPAFLKLFELSQHQSVSGKHLAQIFTGNADFIASLLMDSIIEGEKTHTDIQLKRRGQKHYFDIQMSPIIEEGKVVKGVAVFQDLSQIKRTEKIRRDFVANVSHELRTPLSAINGYAESLLESALEEPELAKEFVAIILKHSERLGSLVQDLLDLSKLESDEPPDFQPINLEQLTQKIMGLNLHAVQDKKMTYDMTLDENLPLAMGHLGSVEQVIHNLIENAIKYSEPQGHVSIKGYVNNQHKIQISVTDTGIGIEPKHIPRLFERFYRVDKARSRDQGGTGLGLSIVKHIVEQHGGEIWVESDHGQGSTFSFTLCPA